MLSYYKSHSPNYTRIHAFVFICAHTLACRLEESEIDPPHHTGTWNHVSIIYGITSTTFSSAHSALFSVSCFFSTFLLYPSLFSSYQPLSVSQQSPGLELFLNMSEWIEGQWVCKRTHRHTHCTTQWCLGIPGMSVSQLETAVCEGWMNEKRTDTLWEHQELIRDEEGEREKGRETR